MTRREVELVFRSDLAADASEVWAAAATMEGVNAELGPWLHMTTPSRLRGFRIDDAPTGTRAFSSWLLLGGIVPIDFHHLAFVSVDRGRGFHERSTSWTERVWEHERRVRPREGGGSTVEDHLHFVPRLGFLRPLLGRIVRRVFEHRHARLRARFGVPTR